MYYNMVGQMGTTPTGTEEFITERRQTTMEEKKKAAPGTKPGRKPMTEKEKAAAAKKRAEVKAKALNMKPVVYVQYQESEAEISALVDAAVADFRTKKKRVAVTDLKLYIKPEERAAYYVINGNDDLAGRIAY